LKKEIKRLAELIDTLKENERLIVTLHYFEGLTLSEIGAMLEISEPKVLQAISKFLGMMQINGFL
jgi:RNA polymerase sigma factor for flagellar operon FliA